MGISNCIAQTSYYWYLCTLCTFNVISLVYSLYVFTTLTPQNVHLKAALINISFINNGSN